MERHDGCDGDGGPDVVDGHDGDDGPDGCDGGDGSMASMASVAPLDTKLKGLVLMMCWDTTTMGKWLCLLTTSAPKVHCGSERSRSSRRVDKIDGEHPEGLPCVEVWWALVASMASMASMVCRHEGALTWKSHWCLVASSGDEWWRRWVAGVLTQRALTWKSLCVPTGEGDTHSCSLIFLPDRGQTCSSFRPCCGTNLRQLLCCLFRRDSRLQFVLVQSS